MARRTNVHVVPHGDRWATRREGASQVSRTYETQTEAAKAARETAQREHGETFIHRPNGQIRDRSSYGNDLYPPEG